MHVLTTLLCSERVQKIARFLISGILATATNISILFLLVHFAGLHYLPASIASYLLSLIVGFSLQKFFTFRDHASNKASVQFSLYTLVTCLNLILNTALMYFFVDVIGLWYIFAQIVCAGVIAVLSYAVYSKFIFSTNSAPR
jgi:putative flippase GtrA